MAQTAAAKAMKETMAMPDIVGEAKKQVDPSRVSIWERRMINPGRQSSTPVLLKEEGWEVRWVNTAVEGRFQRAVYEQGWMPVRTEELRDAPDVLGMEKREDGLARRGERGAEVLMKLPSPIFQRIQRRKAQIEIESLKKTREQLANAAASRFGGNAGDWATGQSIDEGVSGLRGKIVDSKERMVITPESDEDVDN